MSRMGRKVVVYVLVGLILLGLWRRNDRGTFVSLIVLVLNVALYFKSGNFV